MVRDRQVCVRRVANELSISKTSLCEIMSYYLGMSRVCTRWIPKLNVPIESTTVKNFRENRNQDPAGIFGRIATGVRHRHTTIIHSVNKKQNTGRNQAKRHQLDYKSYDRLARSLAPSSAIVKVFF